MTEAELQRLAEIIVGLTPTPQPAPPTFSYWQLLSTVIAGVLVSQITAVIGWYLAQQAKLREARVRLYGALREYRRLRADMAANAEAQFDAEANRACERHAEAIWQRILEAVNTGNDWRFGRLIRDKLQLGFHTDPGSAQALASEVTKTDEIIRALEPKVLPVSERLIDEFRSRARWRTRFKHWQLKLKRFFRR